MIIDTHSHLNFSAYSADRDKVLKRALAENVWMINVGTKYETSRNAVALAEKNENVFAAVGLHPIHIKTDLLKLKTDESEGAFKPLGEDFDYEKYKELAGSEGTVAIGEIGLDYYYRPKSKLKLEQFKEKQQQVFAQQIDLAKELCLPLIIHCRMAHVDVIEMLKSRNSGLQGVIHCFTGTIEEMREYLDLGFHIGFNGIIFKLDLNEAIKNCPLNKILVETDCPYLTPPAEGKDTRNEPIFIKHVIQKISELKSISFKEIAEKTTQNAKELFKI